MKKLPLKSHTTFFTVSEVMTYDFVFPHDVELAYANGTDKTADITCLVSGKKVTVVVKEGEFPKEIELWTK